jgi:prepilin-type N-terminal cleavage/methylation domain-containing protein
MQRRGGFSLVELLAVIIVLGLIATVVTMNWRSILPRAELHSAVRELSSVLQGMRSDAISRNATFELQYDLDEHRYRVVTPFRAGGGLAPTSEERQALAWHVLPPSVRFGGITVGTDDFEKGIVLIRFDAIGSASGHVVTLLQPADDNTYTIEVQGLLGLIDYHEGRFVRQLPKEDDFK